PQVRDLVTPRRKKADVHVLLCSLLYSKVDVIPVVVLVVAFRIIPRSDEQLGGILIVQRPVAIPIGCPYAIFLCQRDGLQNVEALLVSRGNKHFDLLPGQTVEQLPVRVGQPKKGISVLRLKKSAVVRYPDLGERACRQQEQDSSYTYFSHAGYLLVWWTIYTSRAFRPQRRHANRIGG